MRRGGGNPILAPPLELGRLEHVPVSVLCALPPRRLLRLLATIDENPHCLTAFCELVEKSLADRPSTDETPGVMDLRAGRVRAAAALLRRSQQERLRTLQVEVEAAGISDDEVRRLVAQYAPAGLTDGRLLPYAASCTLTHTAAGLAILRLQSFEMGHGDLRRHPGSQLRALCSALGVTELDSLDCHDDAARGPRRNLADAVLEKPIFAWALSLFPRIYLPELLGVVLARYAARISPLVLALQNRIEDVGGEAFKLFEIDRLVGASSAQLDVAIAAAEHLLTAVPASDRLATAERMANGAALFVALEERWVSAVWPPDREELDPRAARVVRIITSRREIASGFHSRVKVGPTTLEALLAPLRPDARRLLDALATSPYVTPGNGAESKLVTSMVSLEGAMFRVFSADEVAAFRDWIDALPTASPPESSVARKACAALWRGGMVVDESSVVPPCGWWAPSSIASTVEAYRALPSRTILRRILDVEKYPDVRVFAHGFMTACLAEARSLFDASTSERVQLPPGEPLTREFLLLQPYSPERLNGLLNRQGRLQKESFVTWSREGAFVAREQLQQDMAGGMAAGLIDGAWLQYVAASDVHHDASTCYLFRIYDDELGNGNAAEHHGNILRNLLEELGVTFPDIVAGDFGDAVHYSDANCTIALLWSCISLFPRRFRPELLGLNLGIESWGVGGAFRISQETLLHHGLDPLLPKLHNAIDNYGDGHTGWAREAVHRYLAEAFRAGGDALRQQLWERVWAGYCRWSVRHQLRRDVEGAPTTTSHRPIAIMPA